MSILKFIAILPITCALCYGARENPPLYFVPGDSASSVCRVLNSAGAPQITSNTLEFPDGQRIDFLNAQPGVACTAEDTENR